MVEVFFAAIMNERDTTKPGLWILDWTLDWTVDLDHGLGSRRPFPVFCWTTKSRQVAWVKGNV